MVIPGWLWGIYEALVAFFDAAGLPLALASASAWGIIVGIAIGIGAAVVAKGDK